MKKFYTCFLFLAFLMSSVSNAETAKSVYLGTVKDVQNSFAKINPATKHIQLLGVTAGKQIALYITFNTSVKDKLHVVGTVVGHDQSNFFLNGDSKEINGKVILRQAKEAYEISTNVSGEVLITPVDIDKVVCADYKKYMNEAKEEELVNDVSKKGEQTMTAPILNSLPSTTTTLYLDFDGENVPASSNWGAINAPASGFTNANITTIWTAVSEDYSPFVVNVTTDRSVFNAAPTNKRMMVIFTPDDQAAPGAGGVAFLSSFGSGEPCWVFNPTVKSALEAASHESGHTMGLSHDGRTSPQEEYFQGHGSWGPIMGAVYSRAIVQWSKGEYTAASQTQNDLSIISGKLTYRVDDAGNTPATSKSLVIGSGGSVSSTSNFGVIEKTTDVDVYGFNTTGGNVTFSIAAKTESGSASVPDLNIQARILNSSGTQVVLVSPTGVLTTAVAVNQNLTAGTYYLEIDGVGEGSAASGGYSDYGSLGQYFISGTIPGGTATGAGINDNFQVHSINVFPNPTSGPFTINIPVTEKQATLEVLNALGQPVLSSNETTAGDLHKEIDLTGQAAGIYCIVIRSGQDVWRGKVIVQ